tara:strand:+ start:441 stop:716 length:276 start_codon:yes stop_codon:yes gene_type:complete
MMGSVEDEAHSGMVHEMLVSSKDMTAQGRPAHTATVGAAVPVASPLPVSVSVALATSCVLDVAVSVGVWAAPKAKLHGSAAPVVESDAGRR